MAPKSPNVPAWMDQTLVNVALDLMTRHPKNKKPSWTEVRDALKDLLSTRYYNNTNQPLIEVFPVPGRTAIQRRLAKIQFSVTGEDAPWSLGVSAINGLPDDASGVLIVMWHYALTTELGAVFTIRIARWINRLRWIPQAGGTWEGHIGNPQSLYRLAAAYAARERLAISSGIDLGTSVMDSSLMLETEAYNLAVHLGLLPDQDMSIQSEMFRMNPAHAMTVITEEELKEGKRPELAALISKDGALGKIMDAFGEEAGAKANELVGLAVLAFARDPSWSRVDRTGLILGMYSDLLSLYQEEPRNIYNWKPSIADYIRRYTFRSPEEK